MNNNQIIQLKELIDSAELTIKNVKKLVESIAEGKEIELPQTPAANINLEPEVENGIVIEGTFTGQNMVGNDSKAYPVPANYASKSKLVPGDMLKLTIAESGKFIYKQIGPVERRQVLGKLVLEDGQYRVHSNEGIFNVLLASVTYFKAEEGDQISLTVPAHTESAWGAIENVLPSGTLTQEQLDELATSALNAVKQDTTEIETNSEPENYTL